MDWDAFFTVHRDLPREGPGEASDVAFALDLARLPAGAAICDAGAGPGGDVAALLAVPGVRVVAVESHPDFAAAIRARFPREPRLRVVAGDMAGIADLPEAPFDLVWCAGALYFLGIEAGLAAFARAVKPGGVVAFTEPCFFTASPSPAARDFWEGYDTATVPQILDRVAAQGFAVLGHRPIGDAGWEAYYRPMEARIAALRPAADARLAAMLDTCAAEAAQWRAVRGETGYLLVVARRA